MWLAAAVVQNEAFNIHMPDLGGRASFSWRTAKFKRTLLNRPLPNWARYPAGVIVTLCADGLDVEGIDVVAVGEEPSGPRFDYALGMAFAALWHTLHERPYTAESLLEIVERVRRTYIEE
jgi:galactokinase